MSTRSGSRGRTGCRPPRQTLVLPTVLETKLSPVPLRPGLVHRDRLVERLVNARPPMVVVCAPAGSGKTTLLAQYAAALDGSVAWVSLDASDNDPVLLIAEIATAIDRIVTIDPLVFSYLQTRELATGAAILVRVVNSLARRPGIVLILDDLQLVRAEQSIHALAALSEHLPVGTRLVVATREVPPLSLARLRASGLLFELGPAELALSASETRQLLDAEHVTLEAEALNTLCEHTEGWATGVYLAALNTRETANPSRVAREFGGDDRAVFDYFWNELLAAQPADRLSFLLCTSVLDRFSASLCDAVLERHDSAAVLAELERANQFIVPLDRRREWYRYHHLFREVLRTALARMEPESRLVSGVHERASRWYEQHGPSEYAIDHALASDNRRRAAALLSKNLGHLIDSGRQATIRRWLQAFTDADLAECPALALGAAWITGQFGERAQVRRYLDIAERASFDGPFPFGECSLESALALCRATLAWDGVCQMRSHADFAYGLEPRGSRAHAVAALCLGANFLLRGQLAAARDFLEEASTLGGLHQADNASFALGLLALVHLEASRFDEAEASIGEGLLLLEPLGLHGCMASGALLAARARLAVEMGDHDAARAHLEGVIAHLPLSAAMPWWYVYLGLAGSHVARGLGDLTLAGSLLQRTRHELSSYPDGGVLPHLLAKEERVLDALRGGADVLCEPLTRTELHILELAPTYLTLEEIGQRLYISRNTVKTHLRGIYGKLSVTCRAEAVVRGRALGLIGRDGCCH